MAEEVDTGRPPERPLPDLQEQPAGAGDAADHGEVVPRERGVENRRLATRRVRADDRRQLVEAGLVYPDDGAPFLLGFAKSAGRRSSCHSLMAASSRWVARRIGFCTLQPICRSTRLTWAGWYWTPNSCRIRLATRLVVHTSPRKPDASAPLASSVGSCSRWAT